MTTIVVIIKLVTGLGTTSPVSLDEEIIKEKIEERSGKKTVKCIRKNKKEGTVSIKLESGPNDDRFKKFIQDIPLRQPITIAPGNTLVINRMEKKAAPTFTILAPFFNEKTGNELKNQLEEENNIKIHKTKRIGKTNVHMIELKHGSKAVDRVKLNNREKETRPYYRIQKCHKCNATTHSTLSCNLKNKICFRCQKEGHDAKNCDSRKRLNQTCRDCKLNHVTGDIKCKKIIEKIQENKKLNKKQEQNKLNKRIEYLEEINAKKETGITKEKETDMETNTTEETKKIDREEIVRLMNENRQLKEKNKQLQDKTTDLENTITSMKLNQSTQEKEIAEIKQIIKALDIQAIINDLSAKMQQTTDHFAHTMSTINKMEKLNTSQTNYFMDYVNQEVSDTSASELSDKDSDSDEEHETTLKMKQG